MIFQGGKRGGNLEHQPSGLIWSLDNWIYSTYNAQRYRYQNGKILKERTAPNGGQWGLTQDVYGKVWYVNAGGEKGPVNFQTPIVYGAFNINNQFEPGFKEVFPLVQIPDVQGGERRFRPDELTLNHFTATCGQEIFRGDRLPSDLVGDILFAEPVGRLIRRAKVTVNDGLTFLKNAYDKSEFIRSRDPNFRPVNMVTGPDGCLYIVDMYRGIIQEGNWVREGSYLREVVKEYGLQNNFARGRIYRLVHQDFKPGPLPKMLEESPADLVNHLAQPNAWWRVNAQKQLILKKAESVAPQLEKMMMSHPDHLARIHALWTLEGLGKLTPALVRKGLKDNHPKVQVAAIQASETLYKAGEKSLSADIVARLESPEADVSIQAMLTANLLKFEKARELIDTHSKSHPSAGFQEIAKQILKPTSVRVRMTHLSSPDRVLVRQGQTIYNQLCYSCHGADGKGTPMEGAPKGTLIAPPFVGSRTIAGHPDAAIATVLHGLTGPVNGTTYQALMVPMASQNNRWIASVLSFIRNSFGNSGPIIQPEDVARVRKAFEGRTATWTEAELRETFPSPIANRKDWKLAASHNEGSVKNAIDGNPKTRFDTKMFQQPGMWFTVELPRETSIAGIRLDSSGSPKDFPQGYKVETSENGKDWTEVLAEGKGDDAITDIFFKPTKTRHLRITQTGRIKGLYWSIHELQLFENDASKIMKAASKKAPVSSDSSFE